MESDFSLAEEARTFGSAKEPKDGSDKRTSKRRMAKYRLIRRRGSGQKRESDPETTEQRGDRAKKGKVCDRAKKGKVDLKMKAKTRTWPNVVKGLDKNELETTKFGQER